MNDKEYNFIERTQSLIYQYDELRLSKIQRYDVTLLLNACLGLLVIIEEKYKSYRPKNFSSFDELKSATTVCLSNKMREKKKTIKNVFAHLRNSIAHCHFSIHKIEKKKITEICFKSFVNDREDEHEKIFEAIIKVDILKKVLLEYSKLTIDNYHKQKSLKIVLAEYKD